MTKNPQVIDMNDILGFLTTVIPFLFLFIGALILAFLLPITLIILIKRLMRKEKIGGLKQMGIFLFIVAIFFIIDFYYFYSQLHDYNYLR